VAILDWLHVRLPILSLHIPQGYIKLSEHKTICKSHLQNAFQKLVGCEMYETFGVKSKSRHGHDICKTISISLLDFGRLVESIAVLRV